MKHTLLLVSMLLTTISLSAQIFSSVTVEKTSFADAAKVAAVSDDGQYLFLTSDTNEGIVAYNVQTGATTVLSDEPHAGWRVDANNAMLLLQAKQVGEVSTTNQHMAYHRQWSGILDKQRLVRQNSQQQADVAVSKRMNSQFGEEVVILWSNLSPNGKKVCYYVSGVGCYVANTDGSQPQFIAQACRAAQWYDDNTIIGMADEDDGMVYTASTIEAYTLDGRHQTLTDSSVLAMYPQPASQAGLISFTTDGGETYLIHVQQ